ncbi:MAG: 3-hydroxybutyryl-CoA dehydrogenase [Thalassobaculaceae bacterium]|jgi:3-hydroxybutyryl-CoA dehydrogenase|tara:strand:- start:5 stop:877 length:873 start_codon:yes stop_codon:yes gene_type:complete
MIQNIGIVGSGQMGAGIAHVAALADRNVVLLDVNEAVLNKALEAIERNIQRQVSRGKLEDGAAERALKRITITTDYSDFNVADLVIEAATENEGIKRKIFETLVPNLSKEALIASNTSSISITRLASTTDRPGKFIGMHFFNPVPIMQLVELIRGIATDDATFTEIKNLSLELGKIVAEAQDYPGFIVNRILVPMLNEAVYALYEGVGTVESIDNGLRLGANHPMGPLQLIDFIGLDTCLSVMQVLQEGLGDPKYRPCPLLIKYVEAGWLGKKTGRGFYDYSNDEPVPTR